MAVKVVVSKWKLAKNKAVKDWTKSANSRVFAYLRSPWRGAQGLCEGNTLRQTRQQI
jgi:hypothetical protein